MENIIEYIFSKLKNMALLPGSFQARRRHPLPCAADILPVPQQQVRECRGHAKVSDEELNNPWSSVEGETLFLQEDWVHFEVFVEDEELVVDCAILVEEELESALVTICQPIFKVDTDLTQEWEILWFPYILGVYADKCQTAKVLYKREQKRENVHAN